MGINPYVLRSRAVSESAATIPSPLPAATTGPAQAPSQVERKSSGLDALKSAFADVETPTPVPAAEKPEAGPVEATNDAPQPEVIATFHLAMSVHAGVVLLAELPAWANGMVELNCNGFLRDLSLHLPEGDAPRHVLAFDLPKQTEQDVRGLFQGAMARAVKNGATRCLMLSDHLRVLEPVVPEHVGLLTGPGLQTLMESASAKQALWKTLSSLRT